MPHHLKKLHLLLHCVNPRINLANKKVVKNEGRAEGPPNICLCCSLCRHATNARRGSYFLAFPLPPPGEKEEGCKRLTHGLICQGLISLSAIKRGKSSQLRGAEELGADQRPSVTYRRPLGLVQISVAACAASTTTTTTTRAAYGIRHVEAPVVAAAAEGFDDGTARRRMGRSALVVG